MATFPHHERLRLVNFTAFADASFEWSPGINAIIGANGTGKTHLIKLLYAVQRTHRWSQHKKQVPPVLSEISNVFQAQNVSDLVRDAEYQSEITGVWNNDDWNIQIESERGDGGVTMPGVSFWDAPPSVFVPAADMIGHTKRYLATHDRYEIDFDQTYRDIVSALLSPPLRDQSQVADTLKPLAEVLGGEVEEEGERFYLRTRHGRQPMPLVAEGLRKIATLYTLIKNGYLRPGDTLFWDEPETNLNPTLMDEVVAALLGLARSGVQVFLTTHSYFILRELDLQALPTDGVRYFSLYTQEDADGTQVETAEDFALLQHNAIMEQSDYIYDRGLAKAVSRKRK